MNKHNTSPTMETICLTYNHQYRPINGNNNYCIVSQYSLFIIRRDERDIVRFSCHLRDMTLVATHFLIAFTYCIEIVGAFDIAPFKRSVSVPQKDCAFSVVMIRFHRSVVCYRARCDKVLQQTVTVRSVHNSYPNFVFQEILIKVKQFISFRQPH